MKTFKPLIILLHVTTLALALTGCGNKEGDGHANAEGTPEDGHEHEPGVSFSAKSGLLVPPETAKFIGLQVADVEERKVSAALRFTALVYRPATEARFASTQPLAATTSLASAALGPAEATLLREGQAVSIEVEGVGILPGRVTALNRDFAKASGQVEVLLAITDESAWLARGAFVTVTVPLGGEKSVVSVPRSALLQTIEGNFVYTVSGDRFVRAAVKLGVVNGDFAEVTDGLYAGDRIVAKSVMSLWMAELQSLRGGKACADGH